jgi:hypothetical protein
MRKLVTAIVLIALGAAVQIVLHADARVGTPRPLASVGAEFPHDFVLTADQAPEVPGAGNGFLIDKHLAAKLECASCHTESPPSKQTEMTTTCLNCHGGTYAKLAETTAKDYPNPHRSHQGELPCWTCHHVHRASELYCYNCHRPGRFDLKTL